MLVYATCSLNKHYIAPYDPEVATTPNLAEFAKEGMVFQRHHTEAGASGIAFASILTGGHAPHHLVFYHPSGVAPEIQTLSEVFASSGYATHFWDAHMMSPHGLGYGQGVSHKNAHARLLKGDDKAFQAVLEGLVEEPDSRAFVLHMNSIPHSPYPSADEVMRFIDRHPEAFESFEADDVSRLLEIFRANNIALQFNHEATVEELGLTDDDVDLLAEILDAAYRVGVSGLDRQFGGVWKAISDAGLADDALVVFTSDHGETLDDENAIFRWAHALHLGHDVMSVPLIIRGGGGRVPEGNYSGVSRSVDVLPTIVGLSGLEGIELPGIRGVDLSSSVRGQDAPPDLTAFFHTEVSPSVPLTDSFTEEELAVWRRDFAVAETMFVDFKAESSWVAACQGDLLFKIRRTDGKTWTLEAFDLNKDGEARDVYDPSDPRHQAIAEELRKYKAELVEAFHDFERSRAVELAVDPEERLEALRALGYVQ